MRLSSRKNVDLPQPDGPMSAVTERSGISTEMSHRACLSPYQNDRPLTLNLGRTRVRSAELRPFRLRSEMIEEYESVDTGWPLRNSQVALCGAASDRTKNG